MKEDVLVFVNKEKTFIQNLLKDMKAIVKLSNEPINNLDKIKKLSRNVKNNSEKLHLSEDFKKELEEFLNNLGINIKKWEEERRKKFGILLEERLKDLNLGLEGVSGP